MLYIVNFEKFGVNLNWQGANNTAFCLLYYHFLPILVLFYTFWPTEVVFTFLEWFDFSELLYFSVRVICKNLLFLLLPVLSLAGASWESMGHGFGLGLKKV